MGLALIIPVNKEQNLYDIITISPGSPPPRPHPLPPLPGDGGPVDPGYSPPWAQIPVDPGYSPPWAQVPGGGGPGTPTPGPAGGINAVIIPMPPQDPPVAPPAGMPAGSTQMLVWFGPGTKPAMAWVGPYASTGPITPPPAPEAKK